MSQHPIEVSWTHNEISWLKVQLIRLANRKTAHEHDRSIARVWIKKLEIQEAAK